MFYLYAQTFPAYIAVVVRFLNGTNYTIIFKGIYMKNVIKFALLSALVATLSGCTGSVYNKEKNCDYTYLLHPAISISKMIGGCGPTDK
jgi:hypothetical protein